MNAQEGRHYYRLGIVGNCSYIAYIDDEAAVRWLCMPRFDSSFLFGSLLDPHKGGRFSIHVPEPFSTRQRYAENTNILHTDFQMGDTRFRVTDFAPRFYQYDRYFRPLMLARKIEPIRGQPRIVVHCTPVGDYGRIQPEIVVGSNHIRYLNLGGHVRLTTDIPLSYVADAKPFVLNEPHYLVFSYGPPLEAPLAATVEEFLDKTRQYWLQWVKTMSIAPIFQEATIRSALVLKLHQFEDTGGIIAAGTTSLPESPQSGRTWDYRYCWLRDKAAGLAERSAARVEACFDPVREVYTQAVGVGHLDASNLQLISLHYLDPASERARRHLAALESQLKADHGLFYRYVHEDDFGKPQSSFLATAFWYVETLACVGRVSEAMDALEHLMMYSNHLGLFSEDVMLDGSQWGNFPQTYSHVGLMNAVYRIARKLDRPIFL